MATAIDNRFVRPAALAAGLTFAMFWTLHLLIVGGKYIAEQGDTLNAVDFVRLKKDTEMETRERKKPPKPEPPKQPPPPKMQVDAPPPDAPVTPFVMPKLNLPTTMTGGPFIGSYVGGDLSGYSELIPLVRISPQYPRQAARDRIEGWVDLELLVAADGTVKSARPVKSQPRGVFESAAIQAMLKAKFKPKIVDGKAVEQKAIQRLEFKLETTE